jgi:hypothetical protein
MATLNEVMKDTADAIREKTGKSELIAPVDFASEIKAISVGGDAPSGVRSSWRYFDVSKSPMQSQVFGLFPTLIKPIGSTEIKHIIVTLGNDELMSSIGAFGVDGDGIMLVVQGTIYTWNEAMAVEGMTPEAMEQMNVIEITEEEFLNKTFE